MRKFGTSGRPLETELLILSDGRIFIHNLTQPFADLLNKLNPAGGQIAPRARRIPVPASRPAFHQMNFQTEIETLIRARYPILYVITSEEMRVQNCVVEIAAEAAEESLRVELQHRHRARRHFHPVAEEPQRRHQRPAGGAGPGHRTGRAGHLSCSRISIRS